MPSAVDRLSLPVTETQEVCALSRQGQQRFKHSEQIQLGPVLENLCSDSDKYEDCKRLGDVGGTRRTKQDAGSEVSSGSLTQAAAVINGWDDLQNALTSKRIDRWH